MSEMTSMRGGLISPSARSCQSQTWARALVNHAVFHDDDEVLLRIFGQLDVGDMRPPRGWRRADTGTLVGAVFSERGR